VTAGWTGPGERWRLLAPKDAVVFPVTPGPLGARRLAERLRALTPGTPVILLDHRPGGRLRARRITATGMIRVERQYVAVPSLRRAIVVAEDTADCLRWASRSLITPPPGVTWVHAPLDAAVRLLRRYPAMLGWLAAGRVVVGRRA
jgi:hypothetical protein